MLLMLLLLLLRLVIVIVQDERIGTTGEKRRERMRNVGREN
jgi:hypothetical protein